MIAVKKWTWKLIHKHKNDMDDDQLTQAIESMMPENIVRLSDKMARGEDLTHSEELELEKWEQSPESGMAGKIMGGS